MSSRRKVQLEFLCPDEGWVQRTFTYPAHWTWDIALRRAQSVIEAGKRELGATEGRVVLVRVCAFCSTEFPRLVPQGVEVTHGVCKRHYLETLRLAGVPEDKLQETLSRRTCDWCPDLSEVKS